ncbi:MAG: hypothetical protein AAFZ49_19255, partial [Cyanobacteria bacterium J06659_2]
MLIDSNLIIYATQPPYARLRSWLIKYATHYSAISRLETLGYHRLGEAEKQALIAILENLTILMIGKATIEIAIANGRLCSKQVAAIRASPSDIFRCWRRAIAISIVALP